MTQTMSAQRAAEIAYAALRRTEPAMRAAAVLYALGVSLLDIEAAAAAYGDTRADLVQR